MKSETRPRPSSPGSEESSPPQDNSLVRRVVQYDPADTDTLRFCYNGFRCVEEYDASTTPTRQRYYVHGSGYIDELAYLENDIGDNTGTSYALHDRQFSVMALANTSGTVVERYKYDSYGAVKFQDANGSDLGTQTSAYGNPFTFTGRRLDQWDDLGLSLMYYRLRYYNPAHGRFTGRDPFGWVDPFGMQSLYACEEACWLGDPRANPFIGPEDVIVGVSEATGQPCQLSGEIAQGIGRRHLRAYRWRLESAAGRPLADTPPPRAPGKCATPRPVPLRWRGVR